MQRGLTIILLVLPIAVRYGVDFSVARPLVPPDGSLATLFAALGFSTAVAIPASPNSSRGGRCALALSAPPKTQPSRLLNNNLCVLTLLVETTGGGNATSERLHMLFAVRSYESSHC